MSPRADLESRASGGIQVHGSSNLAQTLLADDLNDEFRRLIFPGVLTRVFRSSGAIPVAMGVKPAFERR